MMALMLKEIPLRTNSGKTGRDVFTLAINALHRAGRYSEGFKLFELAIEHTKEEGGVGRVLLLPALKCCADGRLGAEALRAVSIAGSAGPIARKRSKTARSASSSSSGESHYLKDGGSLAGASNAEAELVVRALASPQVSLRFKRILLYTVVDLFHIEWYIKKPYLLKSHPAVSLDSTPPY